jgi:DNA invertase Pin-like site-specific DNA recombinase
VRRQDSLAETWYLRNGFASDEVERMVDEGVSAFHGKNSTEGALGKFLVMVKKGEVPRGSYLLIESFDRLSRENILTAFDLFSGLLRKGITIVTLADNVTYSPESSKDLGGILSSIVKMSLAHEESAKKSQRGGATWVGKRDVARDVNGTKLTARAPGWLRLAPDRKSFIVIAERAKIVNQIYEDALRGFGRERLARALNESGCDIWGDGRRKGRKWHPSTITKILDNEAVIGRFQPHRLIEGKRVKAGEVIENYFPAIVSEELYYRVQASRSGKPCMPGRNGVSVANLFTHLAKCARTGMPANYDDKGGGNSYIRTDGTLSDGRRMRGWPYRDFETLFCSTISGLNLAEIFGQNRSDLTAAIGALSTAEAKLEEAEQRASAFLEFITNYKGKQPPELQTQYDGLVAVRNRCVEDVVVARRNLDRVELSGAAAQKATQTLRDLLAGPPDERIRLAFRAEIRRIVERIEIAFDITENAKEREEREEIEAFAKLARKAGAKILQGADCAVPKRSYTIVFQNGVRRTVIEGKDGTPLVYEADEHGTDFTAAVVLLSPSDTRPGERTPLPPSECLECLGRVVGPNFPTYHQFGGPEAFAALRGRAKALEPRKAINQAAKNPRKAK